MNDSYEGDIVRPLGLVTLYSAYTEIEIDALLAALSRVHEPCDKAVAWPVGQKIALALDVINRLNTEALGELLQRLNDARHMFDRRNALVHGAIFSSTSVVTSCVTGREQSVSPEALTKLAREIFTVKEQISVNRQRILEPMLASIERARDF